MTPIAAVALALAAVDAGAALTPPDGGLALAGPPAELIEDARVVYRLVACQGDPLPGALDAGVVAAFCATQTPRYQTYMAHWGTTAREFIGRLVPAERPAEVVYLFGGGDLMTALTAFPEASVITTISLELAGDPRRAKKLADAAALKASLTAVGNASVSTLVSNDSLSKNLSKVQQGELPGQLAMHFMGLAMFGFEPVSVRYFRLESDGAIAYLSEAEIAALDSQKARSLSSDWKNPDFSPAFANVEVQFVPRGQPTAPRRIHRHIAADLSNEGLRDKAPGVLAHLNAKKRVTGLTKAASYLLWNDGFSLARTYLTEHAAVMISDSTGPPPRYWRKAGCEVKTFGTFQKAFLPSWEGYEVELRKEFAAARPIPMRFGYPDGSPEKRSHMLVVKCPAPGALDGGAPSSL